ncbi:hypothetical protein HC031_24910 [Planosporangium thailandense]|uniref:Uncharacterized protein n=1 Tax=Planosporangium thailandense TaxID=765197 RepID=A0ABX0Y3H9_9ACTN|nr:hypothetical protein [Planosporangium thailandense]NJC72932.1 hypothetical protein [Planosporangium thailandense]
MTGERAHDRTDVPLPATTTLWHLRGAASARDVRTAVRAGSRRPGSTGPA